MKTAIRLIVCAVLLATIVLATSIQPVAAAPVTRYGTITEGQATLDYTIVVSTSTVSGYKRCIITVGGGVTAGTLAFGGAKGYIHVYNYGNWNVSGQLFYNVLSGEGHASQTVARGKTSPYFYTTVTTPTPLNSTYLGSGTFFIHIIVDSTYWLYPGIGQTAWVGAYTPSTILIQETSLNSAQTILNGLLAALGVYWPLPGKFPPLPP